MKEQIVTSLGEKIISIGERVASLEQKKKQNKSVLMKIQCSHCGNWYQILPLNKRAMNYCSQCL